MIHNTIIEYLRSEYDSGMTQEEIAKKHNVHQTQIQRILSGKRSASGFTVQTIDNMFPKAVIYLDGNVTATHTGSGDIAQSISGDIHIKKNLSTPKPLSSKILSSEKLTAEEKVKFLQLLEEMK